jgi:hypothetical protein
MKIIKKYGLNEFYDPVIAKYCIGRDLVEDKVVSIKIYKEFRKNV